MEFVFCECDENLKIGEGLPEARPEIEKHTLGDAGNGYMKATSWATRIRAECLLKHYPSACMHEGPLNAFHLT